MPASPPHGNALGAVTIRRAAAEDVPTLVALAREYWAFEGIDGFDDGKATRALRLFFSSPLYGAAWLARDGSAAAGYLIGCYVFSLENGGLTAEIDEFFLREPYRRAGIGTRLLENAEQGFRSDGCTSVFMEVGRDNDAARGFYSRRGYAARTKYQMMTKTL